MKEIQLTQGKVALVDDEDYDWLMQWKWTADKSGKTFYAHRLAYLGGGRKNPIRKKIRMHRLIMGVDSESVIIDHIDGNGNNNQKANLRIVTASQNCMNRKVASRKYTYKGISFQNGFWKSAIRVNDKLVYLGKFNTQKEAAIAYDEAAIKYFGEFACLNFSRENYALAV